MIKKILLLGNTDLYKRSEEVKKDENLELVITDLHDTLMNFKKEYKVGRAIAAPQIGIHKRIIYMYIDKPVVFINPKLTFPYDEKMEVLDDCMSFPNLLVKVNRYKRCIIEYYDANWDLQQQELEGDLSELIQHEYDHLDGILSTMRAIDNQSFVIKE
ncbi:MAG: peptide deformylase [Coprobacillaceae bacterium]